MVRNADLVANFSISYHGVGLGAFSLDVNDIYPSLSRVRQCRMVEACIERLGAVNFSDTVSILSGSFLKLLNIYLGSLVGRHGDAIFVQRDGVRYVRWPASQRSV